MNLEHLKKLLTAFGPSGREEKIRNTIIELIRDHVDGYKVDKVGNLIAWKEGNGENKKRILLDAHMDQIGFVVTHVDKNGFLRVEPVGGILPQVVYGSRLNFDGITGIVGIEKESRESFEKNLKEMSFDNLYVDVMGQTSKVSVGAFGIYDSYPVFENNLVASLALDDRIGCEILVECLTSDERPYNDLYTLFAVQEEHSLLGAAVGGFEVDPDLAIAIDVTDSADVPKANKRVSMIMGKGPAIKVKDSMSVSNPKVVDFLKKVAEKHAIEYQLEVLPFGGTDAYSLERVKNGIPTAAISIPTRYIHTPSEVCNLNDVEKAITLVRTVVNEEVIL
ncbi:M42 family metallopeptidase [Mesoaciditoga sp.]